MAKSKNAGAPKASARSRGRSRSGGGSSGAAPRVRVRMYRQGLGDCFLLTFGIGDAAERHMLIDCGSLGSETTGKSVKDVVGDIEATVRPAGGLTVLVATHEHKDHLSGFNSQADAFRKMTPKHVWLAWTENPQDEQARQIVRYKNDLGMALVAALGAAPGDAPAAMAARDVLGFNDDFKLLGAGKFAKTIDAAMDFVRDDLGVRPTYHRPGDPPVELPEIPGFRFYVLGPPRDRDMLGQLGGHGSSHLYGLRAAASAAFSAKSGGTALSDEEIARCEIEMPFDEHHRVPLDTQPQPQQPQPQQPPKGFAAYYDAKQAWRRVDHDWLNTAADLALQLDSLTNNTSLAIAIERIADGRVLLFPGDAQEGNWLSWHTPEARWTVRDGGVRRTVTAADLLARTVFYKVGHHGSHNATVKEKGLELMTRKAELTAFIPVDRKVALSKSPKGSWQMPARALYRRLLECCEGRVVRSDIGWAANATAANDKATESQLKGVATQAEWDEWAASRAKNKAVTENGLFFDYEL
jgi:glyoxylase-like metal-dependent hydrolase (beta-lactamase superfamily II)